MDEKPVHGYGYRPVFGPASATWMIGREAVLLLGGRRALLMQIAHPLVAQAVSDHSTFPDDRLGRLTRTLRSSLDLVFGEPQVSASTIDRINASHSSVVGELEEGAGRWPRGTRYSASDPDLLLWVHATLIDTGIRFFELFVRALTGSERDRYVAEGADAVALLGARSNAIPRNYDSLVSYVNEMMSSEQVCIGNAARRLSRHLLYPFPALPLDRFFDPLNAITVGTLPEALRDQLGLRWGPSERIAFRSATALISGWCSVAPPSLRWVPAARDAALRIEV